MSTWERSLSFVAALFAATSSGTVYTFSAFSTQLAARLAYSEFQLGVIASSGNYGQFLSGPIAGIIIERIGPQLACLVSATLLLTGYAGLALVYADFVPIQHFAFAAASFTLVGIGSSISAIAFLSTLTFNFRKNRGLVMGFPLGILGLSGFIFARINGLFFIRMADPTYTFLRFLALSTFTCMLLASLGLRRIPPPDQEAGGVEGGVQDERAVEVRVEEEASVMRGAEGLTSSTIAVVENPTETTALIAKAGEQYARSAGDIRGWALLGNTDARLLYMYMAIVGGSGILYINNIGRILAILHPQYSPASPELRAIQSHHVAMLSLFSFLGRLGFGFGSDMTLHWWGVRRVTWSVVGCVLMLGGMVVVGTEMGGIGGLDVSTGMVGMSFGSMFAVSATLVGEWFGPSVFGSNWGILTCGPAIAAQLANVSFGIVYDRGRERGCEGVACYGGVFLGMSLMCMVAFVLIMTLLHRRKGITGRGSLFLI